MKKIILSISIVLFLVACNDNQELAYNAKVMEYDAASSRKSFVSNKRMKVESISKKNNVVVERKLIKTGNVTFETKEIEATRKYGNYRLSCSK